MTDIGAPSWQKPGVRVMWEDGKHRGVITTVSFDGHVRVEWDDGIAGVYSPGLARCLRVETESPLATKKARAR